MKKHYLSDHFFNQNSKIMRNFRKLDVWTDGLVLAKDIYRITAKFPKEEKFGLISQMNRASISVPSNIAEGASRRTKKHFANFLDISIGSAFELETQLIISESLNMVSKEEFDAILPSLLSLQRRLNALRTAILR